MAVAGAIFKDDLTTTATLISWSRRHGSSGAPPVRRAYGSTPRMTATSDHNCPNRCSRHGKRPEETPSITYFLPSSRKVTCSSIIRKRLRSGRRSSSAFSPHIRDIGFSCFKVTTAKKSHHLSSTPQVPGPPPTRRHGPMAGQGAPCDGPTTVASPFRNASLRCLPRLAKVPCPTPMHHLI